MRPRPKVWRGHYQFQLYLLGRITLEAPTERRRGPDDISKDDADAILLSADTVGGGDITTDSERFDFRFWKMHLCAPHQTSKDVLMLLALNGHCFAAIACLLLEPMLTLACQGGSSSPWYPGQDRMRGYLRPHRPHGPHNWPLQP